jgi:hypothetical protein
MKDNLHWIFGIAIFVVIVIAASALANVTYFTTTFVLILLSFIGHFIHLGEDAPGEWDNPSRDTKFWNYSKLMCGLKLGLLVLMYILGMYFPKITQYGA